MKKNGFWLDFLFALLWQIAAVAVVFAAEELVLSVIARFVVLPVRFLLIFRASVLFLGVGALLSVGAWKEAYRAGDSGGAYALAVGGTATVLQMLVAAVFHFHMALGGATYPIVALMIWKAEDYQNAAESAAALPDAAFWGVFAGMWAIYLGVCFLMRHFAAKRRLSDRRELGVQ